MNDERRLRGCCAFFVVVSATCSWLGGQVEAQEAHLRSDAHLVEPTLLAQRARRRPPLEGAIEIGAFDELVFGKGTDAAAARGQLGALLSRRIEAVDDVCRLTAAQRRKLELAGRGEIKRFLDRVEGVRKKDQRDIDEVACRELSQDGHGLRRVFTSGGPSDGSSFAKILERTLTVEQAAKYSQSTLRRRAVGKSQPNRLSFGVVRVGAMVEASVRIILDADIAADVGVTILPPSFVRITQSRMGTQNYGSKGTCTVCDVFVSLTTTDVGAFTGKLQVLFGEDGIAEVPVAATVLEQEPGLGRILIVETPFQRFSTSDASIFDPWLEIVKSANLDVHYLEVDRAQPVLRDLDLSNFDVVMLAGSGICFAGAGDFEKLTAFVTSGGRVIVMANHFTIPNETT
ncbi:MAG TPA: hypothetical protein VND64_08320, partial [Pirellulales bacterium]|nr:hypothetical protein [Pirellulales bacterium]